MKQRIISNISWPIKYDFLPLAFVLLPIFLFASEALRISIVCILIMMVGIFAALLRNAYNVLYEEETSATGMAHKLNYDFVGFREAASKQFNINLTPSNLTDDTIYNLYTHIQSRTMIRNPYDGGNPDIVSLDTDRKQKTLISCNKE